MSDGWKCHYKAPGAARRPFNPEKVRDVVRRVCREFGMWETLKACFAGLWDCGEPPESLCDAIAGLANASHVIRTEIAQYEVVIESALAVAAVGGVLTLKERTVIETALKVLSSDSTEQALQDLHEWLNCGEFRTGGGIDNDGFNTGGGF